MTPQQKRVLIFLQTGQVLTRAIARDELGMWESPSRISQLRRLGYPIKTRLVTKRDKFGESIRIAHWSLGK